VSVLARVHCEEPWLRDLDDVGEDGVVVDLELSGNALVGLENFGRYLPGNVSDHGVLVARASLPLLAGDTDADDVRV
jgi:hypothetical protein